MYGLRLNGINVILKSEKRLEIFTKMVYHIYSDRSLTRMEQIYDEHTAGGGEPHTRIM